MRSTTSPRCGTASARPRRRDRPVGGVAPGRVRRPGPRADPRPPRRRVRIVEDRVEVERRPSGPRAVAGDDGADHAGRSRRALAHGAVDRPRRADPHVRGPARRPAAVPPDRPAGGAHDGPQRLPLVQRARREGVLRRPDVRHRRRRRGRGRRGAVEDRRRRRGAGPHAARPRHRPRPASARCCSAASPRRPSPPAAVWSPGRPRPCAAPMPCSSPTRARTARPASDHPRFSGRPRFPAGWGAANPPVR